MPGVSHPRTPVEYLFQCESENLGKLRAYGGGLGAAGEQAAASRRSELLGQFQALALII